jgi:hypothetical protein
MYSFLRNQNQFHYQPSIFIGITDAYGCKLGFASCWFPGCRTFKNLLPANDCENDATNASLFQEQQVMNSSYFVPF